MSGQQKNTGKSMLVRLTEIERRKQGATGELSGLSVEGTSILKEKLLREKNSILAEFNQTGIIQPRKASARMKTWVAGGIAAMVMVATGLTLILRQPTGPKAHLVFSKGDVQAGGQVLQTGTAIKDQPLTTSAGSLAVIHHGDSVKTILGPGSRVRSVKSTLTSGKSDIELVLEKGLFYSDVTKGQALLKIITPSAEIKVIGTGFSVQTDEQGTHVSVLEGIVQVSPVEQNPGQPTSGKPTLLEAGQKIFVSPKDSQLTVAALSAGELGFLRLLHDLTRTTAQTGLSALAEKILLAENQGSAPKLTLADIRRKYGKISRVNLTNGKSYVGFFTMRGNQLQIITPQGTVRVASHLLRDVRDAE